MNLLPILYVGLFIHTSKDLLAAFIALGLIIGIFCLGMYILKRISK